MVISAKYSRNQYSFRLNYPGQIIIITCQDFNRGMNDISNLTNPDMITLFSKSREGIEPLTMQFKTQLTSYIVLRILAHYREGSPSGVTFRGHLQGLVIYTNTCTTLPSLPSHPKLVVMSVVSIALFSEH